MGHDRTFPFAAIMSRGRIDDQDVIRLKRLFGSEGAVAASEAEALCALNETCGGQGPAWSPFFVDAVTEYIVHHAAPEGYLTASNAEWLRDRICTEGHIATKTGIALLLNVLCTARWSPASLSQLALGQVLAAVTSGTGPLRAECPADAGTITDGEVELVRRVLYAFGSGGHVALSRAEAEMLFDLHDAITVPNAAWTELIVKVVAHLAMTVTGHAIPTREHAFAPSTAIDFAGHLPPAVLLTKLTMRCSGVIAAYRAEAVEEQALSRLERQRIAIITHEPILEVDAPWLAGRLARGQPDRLGEAALLAHITALGQRAHPGLEAELPRLRA